MKSNVDPPGPASEKIRKLFELVADLDAVRRQVLLAESGATREEIAAVTGLLLADRTEASVFDVAPADWAIHLRIDDRAVESMTGATFGPYRILDMIGKGGSSVVFRAVRHVGDAEQTVALKILDRGLFSDESRRRFRREQQILAQFSHANVARLIDGGVSEAGIPYIAMEFVDGMRLTDFASVRGLDREGRLHLIKDLCRVVEAAHRALIVHRDLKPSNVLVAHDGEIKVLDFGTAKLLDGDESTLTQTSAIELTPGYAAPEQYRPGLVTTAADVYALGVLASELLFGVRLGPDAMWPGDALADRAARSGWRDLDPDLQRMLHAALASDPTLRYRSAGYFADDIVRLLRGEPVSVHPPSSMYRLRKFVSRNRGGVSAAAVSAAALTFGLGLAAWQAHMATIRAQQAAIELQRANAMRDFMFAAFGETEPTTPRARPATVLEAVERAIEEARSDRGLAPAVRIEMLTRLGTIVENQGKFDESAELLAWNAKEAALELGRDDPLTLDAERSVADNQLLRGNFTEARTLADALLARRMGGRAVRPPECVPR